MNVNEKLIYSNTADYQLDKEVNKMYWLKILNLIISILIIPLYFFIILLFFLSLKNLSIFVILDSLFFILLFAFLLLFIIISFISFIINLLGTVSNSFWIKTSDSKIDKCCCYLCCCCINIKFLKFFYLLFAILIFLWDGAFIVYYIQMNNEHNLGQYSIFNAIENALLVLGVVLLLLFQSYCFFYYNKFLNRLQIYLEYYKKLIVRGDEKKAQRVRKLLGTIHEKGEDSEIGEELKNINN